MAWVVLAMAVIAFVAVGCSTPLQQAAVVDVPAPTAVAESTSIVQAALPTPAIAARLAITPQPAAQSGQVQVSGDGFDAHESITISVGKDPNSPVTNMAHATAAIDGSFGQVTLILPDEFQSGPHPMTATGEISGRTASATLWIRAPQPWLVLDKYDVPQYGDIGFVAGGFEPMDQVVVSLQPASGDAVQLTTLTTDQAGNAAWTQLKLPRLASGSYALVLQGSANAAELRRDVHVTPLKPVTELSPWAGPPGVPVQFNSKGFAPSEQIRVQVGGTEDATAIQADEYGNLWGAGPIHIPQGASTGELQVTLLGADSGAASVATFKVLEPKPWLELTNWSGAPGAPVGFGGGGWIGGEKVDIHVGSATAPVQSVAGADDNGWLKDARQVYIPRDVTDDVIFVAVGEQSHLVAAATFRVVFPFGLHPKP